MLAACPLHNATKDPAQCELAYGAVCKQVACAAKVLVCCSLCLPVTSLVSGGFDRQLALVVTYAVPGHDLPLLPPILIYDNLIMLDGAGLTVGQAVATLSGGCFADYTIVPAKFCLPAGTVQKEVVALLTSGLTASIGDAAMKIMLALTISSTST